MRCRHSNGLHLLPDAPPDKYNLNGLVFSVALPVPNATKVGYFALSLETACFLDNKVPGTSIPDDNSTRLHCQFFVSPQAGLAFRGATEPSASVGFTMDCDHQAYPGFFANAQVGPLTVAAGIRDEAFDGLARLFVPEYDAGFPKDVTQARQMYLDGLRDAEGAAKAIRYWRENNAYRAYQENGKLKKGRRPFANFLGSLCLPHTEENRAYIRELDEKALELERPETIAAWEALPERAKELESAAKVSEQLSDAEKKPWITEGVNAHRAMWDLWESGGKLNSHLATQFNWKDYDAGFVPEKPIVLRLPTTRNRQAPFPGTSARDFFDQCLRSPDEKRFLFPQDREAFEAARALIEARRKMYTGLHTLIYDHEQNLLKLRGVKKLTSRKTPFNDCRTLSLSALSWKEPGTAANFLNAMKATALMSKELAVGAFSGRGPVMPGTLQQIKNLGQSVAKAFKGGKEISASAYLSRSYSVQELTRTVQSVVGSGAPNLADVVMPLKGALKAISSGLEKSGIQGELDLSLRDLGAGLADDLAKRPNCGTDHAVDAKGEAH